MIQFEEEGYRARSTKSSARNAKRRCIHVCDFIAKVTHMDKEEIEKLKIVEKLCN